MDGVSRNALEVTALDEVDVEMGSDGEFEDKMSGPLWPMDEDNGFTLTGSVGGVSGAYHPPWEFAVGWW